MGIVRLNTVAWSISYACWSTGKRRSGSPTTLMVDERRRACEPLVGPSPFSSRPGWARETATSETTNAHRPLPRPRHLDAGRRQAAAVRLGLTRAFDQPRHRQRAIQANIQVKRRQPLGPLGRNSRLRVGGRRRTAKRGVPASSIDGVFMWLAKRIIWAGQAGMWAGQADRLGWPSKLSAPQYPNARFPARRAAAAMHCAVSPTRRRFLMNGGRARRGRARSVSSSHACRCAATRSG